MDKQTQVQPIVNSPLKKPSSLGGVFSFVKKIGGSVWKWAKAHKIAAGVIAVIVLSIIYLIIRSATAPKVSYVTEKAVRLNLKQTVSATGKVDSDSSVDLKFAVPGEIDKINFQVGDLVAKDQVIASLKHDSLTNQIKEAQAALDLQKANYLRVVQGAKQEQILVSLRQLQNAQQAYQSAQIDYNNTVTKLNADLDALRIQVRNLTQALEDTKTTTNLNIVNSRANLFTSINQVDIKSVNSINQVDYVLSDPDLSKIYSARSFDIANSSRAAFADINQYLSASTRAYDQAVASNSDQDLSAAYDAAVILANKVETMLSLVMQGLGLTSADATVSDARLTSFKSIISAEQGYNSTVKLDLLAKDQLWTTALADQPIQINAAQSSLDSAKSNLTVALANYDVLVAQAKSRVDSAKIAQDLAAAQLELTKSRATNSEIAIAQAQVDQAQSALDRLNTTIKDYEVAAPFDGIIGKVPVKENQSVTMADVIASVIGQQKFKITVDIPESDITKISIGNPVQLTLDAYSNDVIFSGKVDKIDTTETNIADVVYYKVDVLLNPTDQEIKQGMSANLDILTNKKDNALVVPARAVLDNADGTKYVRVLVDGQPMNATVTTGLRGDEGKIEILSGLAEGDLVITFEKKL